MHDRNVICAWWVTWAEYDQPRDQCMSATWSVHVMSRDRCVISHVNSAIPRAPCHWTPLALAVDPFTEKQKSNPQLVLAERPGKCGIYLQRSSRYVLVSVTRVFTCLFLLHARDGCSMVFKNKQIWPLPPWILQYKRRLKYKLGDFPGSSVVNT